MIQIGTMEHSVPPEVLAEIAAEFFEEFQKRFGDHIHILDWSLHLDEETIILTSEGDDTYNVYTFNAGLKRRLGDFAKKCPAVCRLESEDKNIGCQSYVVDKARLSIRLTAPYSKARCEAASERAKQRGFTPINAIERTQ